MEIKILHINRKGYDDKMGPIRKMNNICIIIMCFVGVISSLNIGVEIKHLRHSKYDYFIRCTRRYTPGLCIEPVIPVWTFVFQLQNCTERYGCPPDWRTNRFTSHRRCMRGCRLLVELYTDILSREPQSLTSYLRSLSWESTGRRDLRYEEDVSETDEDDEIPESGHNLKAPVPDPQNDDSDRIYTAVTPDIDEPLEEGL